MTTTADFLVGHHVETATTLFQCLDLSTHLNGERSVPFAAAISYLKTGGVTSPIMPGKSSIAVVSPGDVPQSTFLQEYWNWGYYLEGERLFVDRLADTASDCFNWGLPGVAVNTIDWHMDYHILTCADQALLDLAEMHPTNTCERFKLDPAPLKLLVPGDFGAAPPGFSDDDIVPKRTGGLLSRGIWYNDNGIAVYNLCTLLPERAKCGTKTGQDQRQDLIILDAVSAAIRSTASDMLGVETETSRETDAPAVA